jgi:hypothetical protein
MCELLILKWWRLCRFVHRVGYLFQRSDVVKHAFFFCRGSASLVGQGFLFDVSRSHSGTPHSVGLLWTGDRPVAETSTWQHTTLTRDRHSCRRRDSNPQSQQARGRRPTTPYTVRPLGSACFSIFWMKFTHPEDRACMLLGNVGTNSP